MSSCEDRKNFTSGIADTADCAIGIDAANLVLMGLKGFRGDYEEHILHHRCLGSLKNPVPCVALCPAGVDISGYISLVKECRCADAVRLIRKDNPFPTACAYICEHPCEARCRRDMVDDAVNIRGLKRYAVDNAGDVPQPKKAPTTGKSVAIIGGGPGGLSAAYYLALMGHKVTVYEKQSKLGGMMRYGIPSYRFPRELLDNEINSILSLGIEVHTDVNVGVDVTFDQLRQQHDSLYISIGAHTDKKTGIEGEDSEGVVSAVEMLRRIGNEDMPDFTGQNVVVIGSGNVAMDVTRSAYYLATGKNPDADAFREIRGGQPWKEATISIPGAGEVRVAVVSGLGNTRALMEAVDTGEVEYDFVEVMACPGGCAGGGQPIHEGVEMAASRGNRLWKLDAEAELRFSHENPDVQTLYREYLKKPLGEKSHHLLHTNHQD